MPRSTFVTVTAWIFIVLSGLATFVSLLQNVMLAFMPQDVFDVAMHDTTFTSVMPEGARFVFAHFRLMVLLGFVLCLVTLVSSIGLLRRLNWARLVFIGLMGAGIVYNIAGVVLQQSFMPSLPAAAALDSAFAADSTLRASGEQFAEMMAGIRAVAVAFAVGFTVLFAFIIWKLVSRPIREEFAS